MTSQPYTPAAIAALVAAAERARPFLVGAPYVAMCEALEPFTSAAPPMFSEFARERWGPDWSMGKRQAAEREATYVTKREYAKAEDAYRAAYGRDPW